MKFGILGPKDAGARAKAVVAQWEAGKNAARLRAEAEARRAKPEPEMPARVVGASPVVAPAAGKVLTLQGLLLEAAKRGDKAGVERLLKAGADVNAKNAQGYTALKYAKKNGHDEVVKYLKAHGAKRWFI